MASGDYYLQKNNGTTIDEKIFTAVAGKALGFDASLNPVMLDVSLASHTHSNYVPFTGANQNVNIGNYTFSAAAITGVKHALNSVQSTGSGIFTFDEQALYHPTQTNKIRFTPPSMQEESVDGLSWTLSTRASINNLKELVVGEGYSTNINVLPITAIGDSNYYRLTWDTGNSAYVTLEQLFISCCTFSNTVNIKIEKYDGGIDLWSVVAQGNVRNYPGIVHIPHSLIQFWPALISTNRSQKVRITFSFVTTENTLGFSLSNIEWFGYYPSASRNVQSYDFDKNVTFPAKLTAAILNSYIATGTAPLNVNSSTMVNNLNADLLDGYHASNFSLSGHTHTYDNYVSWDVSANGAAASQIYKSGSASSYKGVNFVGSGTVSVSTNSNANGFLNVNISGSGSTYTHPAYTVFNPTLSGALVLASLTTDAIGSVTAVTTRTLTLANLGYTGATNATYFTGHTIYLNGTSLVTIGSGGYLNVVATNAAGDPVVTLTGNAGAYRYDISVSGIPNCTLTGYTDGSTGLVAATDTLKVAFSKLQYQMPKTLYTNVTDVTLVDATPNDFYSYTLPDNTLSSDNQRLELLYSGSNAANTNGKTIQFYFGGTSYITITNSSTTSLNWFLNITIVRASSSTLRIAFNGSWYTFGNGNTWGTGINFATTNVIKLVAQGAASSDIIGKLCTITHFSS